MRKAFQINVNQRRAPLFLTAFNLCVSRRISHILARIEALNCFYEDEPGHIWTYWFTYARLIHSSAHNTDEPAGAQKHQRPIARRVSERGLSLN